MLELAAKARHRRTMDERSIRLAGAAIVAAQVSVNVGAALAKHVFPVVGPEGVAMLRTGISAAVLLAAVRPWRALRNAAPAKGPALPLVGYGLSLGGMNLLIYWSFERIPIGIAVTIEIAGPLALVLLSSRSARDLLWFALAVASLLLLVPWPSRPAPVDPVGIAFALGAAACWALYILFGRRAAAVGGTNALTLGMIVACTVTFPAGLASADLASWTPEVLSIGIAVALLSSMLPYWLEMTAFPRLTSGIFSVITSCAPAIAALVAFAILGERLTGVQWLSVVLMMIASIGGTMGRARRARLPLAAKDRAAC